MPDCHTREFWERYLGLEDKPRPAGRAFEFPVDAAFAIRVEVTEHEVTLYLVHGPSKLQMGWWDDARWHPYALRWSELEALLRLWRRQQVTREEAPLRLLLLTPFVGFGNDEETNVRAAKLHVRAAFAALGLAACEKLVDRAVLPPSEEDYCWTQDKELGWLFGGEYPCYSLRNREHLGGEEGRFPFQEFRALIEAIA